MWLRREYLVVYRLQLPIFGVFRRFLYEIIMESAGAALGEYLKFGAATLAHFFVSGAYIAPVFGGLHADPTPFYERRREPVHRDRVSHHIE